MEDGIDHRYLHQLQVFFQGQEPHCPDSLIQPLGFLEAEVGIGLHPLIPCRLFNPVILVPAFLPLGIFPELPLRPIHVVTLLPALVIGLRLEDVLLQGRGTFRGYTALEEVW